MELNPIRFLASWPWKTRPSCLLCGSRGPICCWEMEQKKVGIGLIGFGFVFTFLGISLFFDRGLMALSNIFFIFGVAILLGWKSTLQLFERNCKGSISFLLGFFIVFFWWPVTGILLEIYGVFVLFSGFQDTIQVFLDQIRSQATFQVVLYQFPLIGRLVRFISLLPSRMRHR